jgi:penicillin-binding protein 2
MPTFDAVPAGRPGSLMESHRSYDPRIAFFYFVLAGMFLTLAIGLGYQQLSKVGEYSDAERQQNQRRVVVPGPRGNIYDRNNKLLVGNTHRFSVVLHLDELKSEIAAQRRAIRRNFVAASGKEDLPRASEIEQISRVTLVQSYLDQLNSILRRHEQVDARALRRHFERELLLPYTLLDGLDDNETARLLERLPVNSPLQVYAAPTRWYPHGSAAAHTLGYVRPDQDVEADGFPGADLTTFKMRGTTGRDGLEKWFDDHLQGVTGGRIFRVDPLGYKINPPLEQRAPKRGNPLVTSLDIDLQLAAEEGIGDQKGAAVAIDVATGEILVMASKPDYDLNQFSPRATRAVVEKMNETGAWNNLALNGFFPPGSTFKILTAIAGLRHGVITPDAAIVRCTGTLHRHSRAFVCYNGRSTHGDVLLREAISDSCDIYFYEAGWRTTPDLLAAEARRFHLDRRTGIELPNELGRMVIPDPAWKEQARSERWYPGDTANMAIGQGFVLLTPLEMACFTASVARGEVFTQPTLLHDPNRPRQQTESIGLTPGQRAALIQGMEDCTITGTADVLTTVSGLRIPGVRIAGKTGTAQIPGNRNAAWFICFAPVEKPEIAIAVMIEGEVAGEEFGGGRHSAPIAQAILKQYFARKSGGPAPLMSPATKR